MIALVYGLGYPPSNNYDDLDHPNNYDATIISTSRVSSEQNQELI